MGTKLSILICGIHERMDEDLRTRIGALSHDASVEVLYLADNRRMTVGRKRNILLSIAQGEWFTFVDDDDEVAPDYIERILHAIAQTVDEGVICFPQTCHHADTGEVEHCVYGLSLPYSKTGDQWTGKPAHTQCWRTEAVNMVEFPEGNLGEDVGWVAKACQKVTKEYRIPDCPELYFYKFDPAKSRTRGL
jgi:glycosyltransferase involved in cell wall biosynthesis